MYRKKQTEFQYAPVIIKVIEDVTGGGTIARAELKGVIDELPPGVVVGVDSNGLYHVVKTAKVSAIAAEDATSIQVEKGHLLKVGDAVTVSGDLSGAADVISSINTANVDYDVIALAATIGAAAVGDVLVLAEKKAAAGASKFLYTPEAVTMNKVDTTVANQQSGLLARGSVNERVMPYPVDSAIKALMPLIRFV